MEQAFTKPDGAMTGEYFLEKQSKIFSDIGEFLNFTFISLTPHSVSFHLPKSDFSNRMSTDYPISTENF